ncbi:MAG TPA: c-type cytochrome domain-containing protein, partial [Candidatus Acidoferrum sp.]|nr:c-type cytochrome domain-containing protein [Candidatus Acidoferrum sp.]
MTSPFRSLLERLGFAAVPVLLLPLLTALLLLFPPDGIERAPLLQFVGRFHPLSVHFPIAVLLIVPLFELVGRKRRAPFLLASVDFLLLLAACGAVLSAVLGWCLARAGGSSGPLVRQHMWGGLLVATAAWICWWLRSRADSRSHMRLYAALLVATVVLVSFTGYRGGQLAHGETHMTEFLPSPLARWLEPSIALSSVSAAREDSSTFYGARIQPLFESHCVTCHGQSKHKAGLRLDGYLAVMRGGKHGPVVKPGDPKDSELYRRITLSESDDDFMPAEHKKPLSQSDVKLIGAWIAEGASRTVRVTAALPDNASTVAREVEFPDRDPAAVARERTAAGPILLKVQLRLPNIVDYESRTSADLVVNASWRGSKFGDADLAELAPLGPSIVAADFSGTAITDRSAGVIAAMKKLRHLRLAHTAITDGTVQSLASLDQLESLSVFDTRVTELSLATFTRLARLRKVYAGETRIPPGTTLPPP